MKDLAEAALNAAQVKGASYADVRLDEHVTQDIIVKNMSPEDAVLKAHNAMIEVFKARGANV